MSLELSSIAFKVETKELDAAVQKLGDLQKAVTNLNKPIASTTLATEKLAQAQAKTAKEQAKAEEAANKAAAAQVKLEKATTAASRTASSNTSILERQQKILEFMTQGMSKGQASILATAHATGILDEESKKLIRTLDSQRKLLGSEPFDKSLGAIKVMKNELGALRESQRQYNSGVELTVKQAKDLYREKFRLIEAMKIERNRAKELGDSTVSESERYKKLKQDLRSINSEYVALAKQRNSLSDDASAQELKRKMNNLSRGLAPQISDVAVSLYGGMSPMTVLMQQGLQVRDLIQSSGVEASKLNEVLKTTGKDFIGTLTGTFKAVGALTVGVFQSAGQSVLDFTMQMIPADFITRKLSESLTQLGFSAESVKSTISFASNALTTGMSLTIATLTAAIVAGTVALKQLSDEQTAVAQSNARFGAAFGASTNEIIGYNQQLSALGITSSKASELFVEIAKTNNINKESFVTVAASAAEFEKYVGGKATDVIKVYADTLKDPVKGLTEFGVQSGYVSLEQIKLVDHLLKTGEGAKAQEEAVRLLKEGFSEMSASAKADMSNLDKVLIDFTSTMKLMWNEFKNSKSVEVTGDAFKTLISILAGVSFSFNGVILLARTLATQMVSLATLDFSGVKQAGLDFWKELDASAQKHATFIKNVMNGVVDSNTKMTTEQRTQNQQEVDTFEKKKSFYEWLNKSDKDTLTRQEYINKQVADWNKKLGVSVLTTDELAKAQARAGLEWDKAHKQRTKKDPTETAYQQAVKTFTNDANAATAAQENYTKAQQDFLNVATSPAWNKFSPDEKQNIVRLAEEAIARETLAKSINEQWEAEKRLIVGRFKSEGDISELEKSREQRGDSEIINAQNKLQLLDEELADMLLQKAIYGDLTAEQKKQLEYAKIQKEYKAEELRITKLLADPKSGIDEMTALWLRNINYEAAAKKRQNIDQAIILENNKYEYEQRVQLAAGISSSIEAALFEGSQAGSKKLRSVIEAELRKPITLFIQAFVQDIFGLNGAGDTMSKAVSAFDKVLGFVNGGYASGLTKAGTSVVGSLVNNEVGAKLGLSYYDGTKYTTTGLGDTIGKTAGQVGGAMTAYGLQKGLSGGYKTGAGGAVDALTAIGGFFDPTGGLIAGTIGAAVNRAFGRKLTETGIEGTFGGSQGFTGNQYSFEKGGWFRSDRTKTSELDPAVQKGLAGQFNVLRAGMALMSTSLGLGTKSIEDFTYEFKLNLMGLSEADATKKLKEEFDKVGVAIADTIPELNQYRVGAETNLDTLTRLSAALSSVNSVFELLGYNLKELSLSGASSADSIAEAYGGLDKFESTMSDYYDKFYSEEDKRLNDLATADKALGTIGISTKAIDFTRESFKELINSLVNLKGVTDPSVVSLLKLVPAMDSIITESENLADKAKEKSDKLAKESADKAKELADKAKESADKITDSLKNLSDETRNSQIELYKLQGKTAEANHAFFLLATEGMTDAEVAAWKFNKTLSDQIEFLSKAKESVGNFLEDAVNALNDLATAEKNLANAELDARIEQVNAANEAAEAMSNAAKSLRKYLEVETKTPQEAFSAVLGRAMKGDKQALEDLTSAATASTESSKGRAGSYAEYALAKAKVLNSVKEAALYAESMSAMAEVPKKVSEVQQANKELIDAIKEFSNSITKAISVDLLSNLQQIDLNGDLSIQFSEFSKKFEGSASEATLSKIFNTLDTNGDGQISLLEAIKGNTNASALAIGYLGSSIAGLQSGVLSSSQFTSQVKAIVAASGGSIKTETAISTPNSAGGTDTTWVSAGGAVAVGGAGGTIYGTSGNTISVADAISNIQKAMASGNYMSIYNAAVADGISSASLDAMMGWPSGSSLNWALSQGLPAFANGGYHSGGLRLVGEKGPEVELTGPSRIISNSKLSGMLNQDSGEVVAAIKDLNSNISLLRQEMQVTAINTGKTERILNRVTNYGESMQVTTTV